MPTNLAYLETAATEALDRELEDPTIPQLRRTEAAQAGIKLVAGFALRDEGAERQLLEKAGRERKEVLQAYRADRDRVTGKLSKLGLEPLAVLPKTAWERICRRSDLYRLAPNRQGEVLVSDASVKKAENFADVMIWFPLMAVCLTGGALIAKLAKGYLELGWWGFSVSMAVASFIVFLVSCGILTETPLGDGIQKIIGRAYLRRAAKRPWERQLRDLLPEGTSPEAGLTARVLLPEPPAETQATLFRARELDLKVAAAPAAIGFENLSSLMVGLSKLSCWSNQTKRLELSSPFA